MKNEQAKNIRWGIIGLGGIAQKFATDLATVPNCKLIAVASRDQQKANGFAKKFNAKIAFGSYEELSHYNEIDAVYIATPHSFHKEHSILCLKHKKAVLCEKPFAMNANEVDEMIITAKENNVLLMEALWTYFLPHYRYVLELIKTEKYGKIKKVEADFGFYTDYNEESRVFKKEVGGGSLLDIGIYPIFAALSTLGIPDSIDAKAAFFESGADSSCRMIFQYDNVRAVLKSTLLEETPTEAIFTCEKAVIKINTRFHEPSSVSVIQNNEEKILDFPCDTLGYNFEIVHFNQLLRGNKKESDVMTIDFSRNLIKTLDMVRNHINLVY
tara:strand:- start:6886 stop:7866 length:981 start_codon:yes stop_codon:yes gene_type:complete